jgi:hypothetical protein
MDRLYVYLVDQNDVPVCYWKGKVSQFTVRNCRQEWHSMVNDRYHNKVKSSIEAGLIQFKLSINSLETNPSVDWDQTCPRWKQKQAKRYDVKVVRCFIFQCRDLPSGDVDGSSDAQVTAYSVQKDPKIRSKLAKTNVSKDNLDPLFYEVLDIEVCYNHKIDQMPPFILDVHDKDSGLFIDSKDHLGRAIIKIKDVFDGENGSFVDLRKSS